MLKNLILILLIFISEVTYSQIMKTKSLKKKDLKEFLEKNHGTKVTNTFDESDYVNFYECDNNMLVIENTKAMQTWIVFDRKKFYEDQKKQQKWFAFKPFQMKQSEIKDLSNSKEKLMNEFFDSLKVTRTFPISNIDLNKVNQAIKGYGYEKAIENLYTNLIIFMGEYVKEKRSGDWVIKRDESVTRDINYKPVFVDEKGKDYDYDFNVVLLKTFYEKKKIDIKQQIEFSLLPNPFQVEGPPKTMHPR